MNMVVQTPKTFKSGIRKSFFLTFFFSLLILSGPLSQGQSLQDLATLQVDQLTDTQIRQLVDRAQASGIGQQQLYTLAQRRGMPSTEIAKLRQRINQLGMGPSQGGAGGSQIQELRLRQAVQPGGLDIFESLTSRDTLDTELTEQEKKIFGYSTFHNKNLNFSPNFNMATPSNYVVGPGDQLIIQIYGVAQDNYTLIISPEGKVNIPNIGLVHVGGFSIDAVSALLRDHLSKRFSGLKSPQPNTFLSVTIGNIRTIKLNIVGELRNPGTYTLPSFATVYNALYAAGGPTTKGTFRNIQVYRAGKLVAEVDIYQFLTRGKDSNNIMLEDNDVILVRPLDRRIEIMGEVRTPGYFEVRQGETLADVIFYAGGFSEKAYRGMISARRNTSERRMVETVRESGYGSFEPRDGDLYLVGKIQDLYTNRVQISGAVLRPGEFELTEGMTLSQLIDKAGGLQGDAFLSRATLYRTGEDFTLQAKAVDIKAIMNGSAEDIPLQNEDIIHIPSRYDVKEEYYVEISGEVNRTGVFPFAQNLTVGDLILRAGGLKEAASNSSIEIARRVSNDISGKIAEIIRIEIPADLRISDQDQSLELLPFDHVFVRRSPGYREQKLVTIDGEVFFPGTYALESATMRISDLLKRAGGPNQFAYPRGATLVRRTEVFQEKTRDELTAENLERLRQNTVREDLDNTTAEKFMMERIEQKLQDRNREIEKQRIDDQESLLDQQKESLLADAGSAKKIEIKETERVGISLDKILANPGSEYDLILQEGDVINVPKQLQTVRLRGEVLYPTTTRFDRGKGFKRYITSAGGFTEVASKKRSYIIYANGDVKRTISVLGLKFYPGVEPGAEIIVPQGQPKTSFQQSISQITGITTSLLTLYLLISNIPSALGN